MRRSVRIVALCLAAAAVALPAAASGTLSATPSKTWVWNAPSTGSGDEPQIVLTRRGTGPIFVSSARARLACPDQPLQAYSAELETGIPVTGAGAFSYDGPIGGDVEDMSLTLAGKITGTTVTGTFRLAFRFGDPEQDANACTARSQQYTFKARCTVGCDSWAPPTIFPSSRVCAFLTVAEARRVLRLASNVDVRILRGPATLQATECEVHARFGNGGQLGVLYRVLPNRPFSHTQPVYSGLLTSYRGDRGVRVLRPAGLGSTAFGAYGIGMGTVVILHREYVLEIASGGSGTLALVKERYAQVLALARLAYPRFKKLVATA